MSRRASIDIGSNSILLLVADYNNGELEELYKESKVTGLGRDLDKNGKFLDETMTDSYQALKFYAEKAKELGVKPSDIITTATEASRVAGNAKVFFSKVLNETGINVQTITGEAEAYYSARGVSYDKELKTGNIVIMDIGGASTELIQLNLDTLEINNSISLPIGAVRATNWMSEGNLEQNISNVLDEYGEVISKFQTDTLMCVAGTMTSIGNMHLGHKEYIEDDVHGLKVKSSLVQDMEKEHESFSQEQFLEKFPFLGKRSRTIRGGMFVANFIFKLLNVKEAKISTYGLRYGTLLEGKIKDEHLFRK
jgi:exopolyphosphatase/guanosine-5'-triphosphate,3'-diphosphate pyrophosphatase